VTQFTKAQFRWLLVLYCFVVAMTFAVASNTMQLIPQSVVDAQNASSTSALLRHTRIEQIAVVTLVVGVLVAGAGGIIGMFFLSRVGVYGFAIAVCLRTALSPLLYAWHASTGWKMIFDESSLILEGVIFALVLFGPAKHLFAERRESNQAMQRTAPRSDA
jgi:hypothetical protein